ncbi:histidine phosphatase family protein [Solitalea sp. MAHUQ-68]|uniref:Histidine phosphatase family protein n=1 Tax=Solitalea agri TaxID=2953739 RepID=A0A9X2F2W4_9SPHI|nr:phosphoglycerate mutase family protein [Solitalea agri]MCO4293220.1 histidine phosphatase family protein [Solitalea agri]
MKNHFKIILLVLLIAFGCKKNDSNENRPKITSLEYKNDLLFVNKANFKIETNEPAEFSSSDPKIQLTSDGLIQRITSSEVVAIDVIWKDQAKAPTRIYALGATDDSFDQPYAAFHGTHATDPYNAYLQGWATLRKLPVSNATYAIILRHADADNGVDFSKTTGPANWWTSCDSTKARQLNQQGKNRSIALGTAFKDLHLNIKRVFSSEFCRAKMTAELINAGPTIKIDNRLNHASYNVSGGSIFGGIRNVISEQSVDNNITLIVTHHAGNEMDYPSFPAVSPFTWTGAYFIKINKDNSITYAGAASWGMFMYWRDLKTKSN